MILVSPFSSVFLHKYMLSKAGYRTKSVDEKFLIYSNFNVKTWYIFLRINVLGGIYYEAGKLSNL